MSTIYNGIVGKNIKFRLKRHLHGNELNASKEDILEMSLPK